MITRKPEEELVLVLFGMVVAGLALSRSGRFWRENVGPWAVDHGILLSGNADPLVQIPGLGGARRRPRHSAAGVSRGRGPGDRAALRQLDPRDDDLPTEQAPRPHQRTHLLKKRGTQTMANITTASSHADQARSGPHRCYACGQFAGAGHECPTMDRAHLSTTGALVPSPTAQDADPKTPAPMVPADADVPHRGDVRSARVAAGLAALRYRRTGDRGPLQEALAARRAAVVGEAHPDTGEASAQEAEAPGGPGWCAQCGQFSGQGHSCPQPPGLPSADYAGMSGEARVKAMLGDLTASVQAVVASGQLQRWLDGMASNGMNRWSANNRLLAMVQMVQRGEPVEDLHLMGFRQWEGHGRHVRKGARSVGQ